MSLVHVLDPNAMVTCPFDRSHRISAARFSYHIVRCGQNHPDMRESLVSCPFNANHIIPAIDKAAHIAKCPDKIYVERESIQTNKPKTSIMVPPYEDREREATEDWDLEAESNRGGSYLDEINRSGRNCNQNAQNFALMPPAEKKKIYNDMWHGNTAEETSSTISRNTASCNVNSHLVPALERMRLPNTSPKFGKPQTTIVNSSLGLGRGTAGNNAASVSRTYQPPQSPTPSVIHSSSMISTGRGRGIGRGTWLTPCAPMSSSSSVGRVSFSSSAGSNMYDSSDDESQWQTVGPKKSNNLIKEEVVQVNASVQDLEWQLMEVKDLENRQKRGAELSAPQLGKIAKKREIERELEQLKKK